eukprot:GHVU01020453.1.p1 GENE.GHVU01020453.1~~GHVU01020453.1.p1  ORF type:complete len:227 (+),score=25.02 GHVU01020453.1:632-1312(+)
MQFERNSHRIFALTRCSTMRIYDVDNKTGLLSVQVQLNDVDGFRAAKFRLVPPPEDDRSRRRTGKHATTKKHCGPSPEPNRRMAYVVGNYHKNSAALLMEVTGDNKLRLVAWTEFKKKSMNAIETRDQGDLLITTTDGVYLARHNKDKLETQKLKSTQNDLPVTGLTFLNGGTLAAVGSADYTIQVIDVTRRHRIEWLRRAAGIAVALLATLLLFYMLYSRRASSM